MSVVAEALLSASLQLLFDKLASPDLLKLAHEGQVHAHLKKWEKILKRIRAVLNDAEEKQMTNQSVKLWLGELRDLAYDVEDILDELATEALRRKLIAEANTSQVWKFIPTCCTNFNPSVVMFNAMMVSKIEGITTGLKDIENQKRVLELRDNTGGRSNVGRERPPTTSLNEHHVYGRDDEKKEILKLLFSDDGIDVGVSVISIVGMGGIGKTTLARFVYNDDEVKGHFNLRVWACVSGDFDVVGVTKTILQSLTSETVKSDDLNWLQGKVSEKLYGRKFLLVLDDVWHESYDEWTVVCRPFEVRAPGSKVVVTTRNQGVSSMLGTIQPYLLKELQNDACLSVFTQHALGTRDFNAHQDLKEIGDKIVKRCKGLPLAAKTLGGLLRAKLDCSEWEKVLNSEIWEIPEEKIGLIPALRVSYHYLPSHLKQCFAYCSILPKGYEFVEKEMILLWMAEGLFEGKTQPEDLGCEYFRELLSRSLFQVSSRDKSRFVMHDLVNDLAQSITREICFRLENDKQLKISKKARHSSYIGGRFDGVKKFEAFYEAQCLRTFLPLMLPQNGACFLTNNVFSALLPRLKCLRVLSLAGYYITKLPDRIGDLKHLRSLDLSHTKLRSLPDSVNMLYNLQTLLLRCCSQLEKLPSEMRNLINLRHLDITGENLIGEMPLGIGKITCLRTLSNFVVGHSSRSQIIELMNLSSLQGSLSVSQLENVVDAADAWEARLHDKSGLKVLEMKWSKDFDDRKRSKSVETEVLDMLQPHTGLEELTIEFYGGTEFPTWLGDASFKNIVTLNFINCLNCGSIPPVGKLPMLKYLCIIGMNGVNSVGLEFYGEGCSKPFSSLKTLHFEDMEEWKEWKPSEVDEQVERFPCLTELSIKRCPKLSGKLPDHLPSLEKLVIRKCEQLFVVVSSLSTLCRLEIEGCKGVECKFTVNDSPLTSVELSEISILACLQTWGFKGLTKVEQLKLTGFVGLKFLWQKEVGLLHHFSSLRQLEIRTFPQLVSFGPEEEDEQQVGLPCSVEYLELADCERLEKLPKSLHGLTLLRELCIKECPRLVSFAEISLPLTLKKLDVGYCENLRCLLEEGGNINIPGSPLLEYLHVEACPSMKCLSSRGKFPATLRELRIENCAELEFITETFHNNTSLEYIGIWNCGNLKSLPKGLHNLSYLHQLHMWHCSSLVSFPEGGLPTTNLRLLFIEYCEKLEARINISSLQELQLYGCPGILSFTDKGFPTKLTSLYTDNPKIIKSLSKWRFQRLTFLKELTIYGGCLDLVPFLEEEVGMMLPTSLTKLTIINFPNLENLSSKGFQNFTSLEYLAIYNCPHLKCFPDNGLPSSLLQLYIYKCPLLTQCCVRDKGQEWRKIAHIPCVVIDGGFIYDPEEEE